MKLPLNTPPRRLCIFRLSALGDVTHVVPVINAIRNHWPAVEITWVIGKLEHKLLSRLSNVEFIVFDKGGGWPAIKALKSELDSRQFDVLLQMQVALRANLLSRWVQSPIRLGWNRERSRDRHHWFTNQRIRHVPFQHQVEGFLEFAWALGIPPGPPEWSLPISDADREWAAMQLPGEQRTLLISPCSSHPLRNWKAKNYARVADHAIEQYDVRVALIGGPSELEKTTGEAIISGMKHRPVNLIGKDSLSQSMALLERAKLLLSPDSGPVHIASALGTPVLGLYAATWARRSGPWRSLELCVDCFPEAARKFRSKDPEQLRWGTRIEVDGAMDLIKVEDVCERLEHILGVHRPI